MGVGENEGNGNTDKAKEKDAARSFVSSSLENKTKESWPLPVLTLGES